MDTIKIRSLHSKIVIQPGEINSLRRVQQNINSVKIQAKPRLSVLGFAEGIYGMSDSHKRPNIDLVWHLRIIILSRLNKESVHARKRFHRLFPHLLKMCSAIENRHCELIYIRDNDCEPNMFIYLEFQWASQLN